MEFRRATVLDVDEIVAFNHAEISKQEYTQVIQDKIEASTCYVAVKQTKVVAYAILNYNFYGNGWIEMLFVLPNFRRQSIASLLVRHLVNVCRTPKLFTSTNESNLPMQGLLSKLGFIRSGLIENLDEGDPELVYLKRLR